METRSIGGVPGGVGASSSEAVCLSGTLAHTRRPFPNFFQKFFTNSLAVLSHLQHTRLLNNTRYRKVTPYCQLSLTPSVTKTKQNVLFLFL